ncbi:MAG: LA2681 family HEPN domain-containing protein [Rhodothermia bacterium]
MALGNLGIGLYWYANHLYDRGHAAVLLKTAHECLGKAVERDIQPGAREGFARKRREIEGFFSNGPDSVSADLHGFGLGSTPEEIEYREWSLHQRLFLNPLNDLGAYSIASRDILTEPPVVVGIDEGLFYPGFFNQMKQEYVSARFLFFEGSHMVEPHYSDAGVHLYDTMDYPCYGLSTEKVRIAFRMAYSLLDKTAFFLNHYLGLGTDDWRVSFKTIWYERGRRTNGLRNFFVDRRNLPFRGLFWLSKDLFEDREDFREAMEPDAEELSAIRHHLEHKYLKLHEDLWCGPEENHDQRLGTYEDDWKR